jgi:hypothetical protein
MPLAGELRTIGRRPPSTQQPLPERHLHCMRGAGRVDAHLDHPRPVSVGKRHGLGRLVLPRPDHAERKPARGPKRAPAIALVHELSPQIERLRDALIGDLRLDIDVDSCCTLDPLEVEVRRSAGRLEAPQLGMPPPGLTCGPAKSPAPEGRSGCVPVFRNVDDSVNPGHTDPVPAVRPNMWSWSKLRPGAAGTAGCWTLRAVAPTPRRAPAGRRSGRTAHRAPRPAPGRRGRPGASRRRCSPPCRRRR